jgi:hypothetical protein
MHAIPAAIVDSYANSSNGTHSAELIITLYGIYGLSVLRMRKIDDGLFVFGAVFFIFSLFIFHNDISRYLIPLAPFSFLIAFDGAFRTRDFKLALCFLIAPLTYVYSIGQVHQNLVVESVYENLIRALGQ